MSKRDAKLYLDDIITAAEKIEEYTKGVSFENFQKMGNRLTLWLEI